MNTSPKKKPQFNALTFYLFFPKASTATAEREFFTGGFVNGMHSEI
jgi:hypothetical protein